MLKKLISNPLLCRRGSVNSVESARALGHLRLLLMLVMLAPLLVSAGELPYYNVLARDPGSWPQIFSSIGLEQSPNAHVFVARAGAPAAADWPARVEKGVMLVLEGESPLAESSDSSAASRPSAPPACAMCIGRRCLLFGKGRWNCR